MARRLRSANRRLLREINATLILGIVREHGPIARTDIATLSGLSPATVSGITNDLIAQGLIYEQEAGASTGGRPPILLSLNRQAGLVLGAKLTEREIVSALIDLDAAIVDQQTKRLPPDPGPEQVVAAIADLVSDLRSRHARQRIFGLGLGMAGVIDRRAGVCRFSPFFRWRDVPLGPLLAERLGLPVILDNDVNTLTLAEQWFGTGSGVSDFLVVTLGRGVGMGMILNGQLYRGGCGGAGEFGHITLDPEGPTCDCGKHGCLEALVSNPALLRQARAMVGHDVDFDEAVARARDGDGALQAIFAGAGRRLGLALSHLVNVFNPRLVIVGGEGARAADLFLPALRETLAAHCFDGFFDDLQLVVDPWGDDAWARGAAGLMLEEIFRPTLYRDEERPAASLTTAHAQEPPDKEGGMQTRPGLVRRQGHQ
ncbi:MAG: ROK family protein [Chloroflexota bacterium]